jgi:hypothetical protein
MKYVGITGGDLATRWEQHRADTNSAVYKTLRTEGYRMTMEILEEVNTKPEALKKEQEYIRSLGTATPNGWNRRVSTPPPPKPKLRKWERCEQQPSNTTSGEQDAHLLMCPHCLEVYTHTSDVEVYNRYFEDSHYWVHTVSGSTVKSHLNEGDNPSPRRDGIRIYFTCESCHSPFETSNPADVPPPFELLIYQHKGETYIKTVYYIEDNS